MNGFLNIDKPTGRTSSDVVVSVRRRLPRGTAVGHGGTLDPEALNSAMNTLIDLQNTGRLVGIISHVPELEERIDARLKVTPARNGSTAEFDIAQ